MIHQVRMSTENEKRLGQLLDLQMLLLGKAASLDELKPETFTDALRDHLDPQVENYDQQVKDAVTWLTQKRDNIVDNLNTFAASAYPATKQAFIADLQSDVNLLYEPRAGRLKVAFSSISDADEWGKGRIAVGKFCRHFYTLLGKRYKSQTDGFPSCLFPDNAETGPFDRWRFIENFAGSNSSLYLCAICDATAYRTQVDSRAYTSIEHFFPKSIYPHLAIHPYNLIPICTFCNSNKSADDLMALCTTEGGISDLVLPYRSVGFSQSAYIEISDRSPFEGRNRHPLEIKIKPAAGSVEDQTSVQKAFANFESVFDIQNRWNNELEQVGEQTFRRLQQFLMPDVQMGNDLSDVKFVKERIGLLMALTSQENLGRDPFAFAGIWLLKYFEDSIEKHGGKAAVFQTLQDWAQRHRSNWVQLQEHAKEIRGRVPSNSIKSTDDISSLTLGQGS